MWTKIATFFLDYIWKKIYPMLESWFKSSQQNKENEQKNKEDVEALKNASTSDERKKAAQDIIDGF